MLPRENQALLVGRDPLFVLDLGLDVVDGVAGLDLEGDGLAREGLDETGFRLSACVLEPGGGRNKGKVKKRCGGMGLTSALWVINVKR